MIKRYMTGPLKKTVNFKYRNISLSVFPYQKDGKGCYFEISVGIGKWYRVFNI